MKTVLFLVYDIGGVMYEWQNIHYYNELSKNGWNVCKLSVTLESEFEDVLSSIKKYILLNKHPDLIVSSLDDRSVNYLFKKLFDSLSIPTLLICFDNLSVPHKHKKSAKYYDLVWLTSYETMHYFTQWGATSIFMPYAANPYSLSPNGLERQSNITFLGSPYGARKSRINILAESGVPISIYSKVSGSASPIQNLNQDFLSKVITAGHLSQFPIGRRALVSALFAAFDKKELNLTNKFIKVHKPVSFDEISSVYHQSSLCLNVSELWNTHMLKNPVHKLHLRTFEIPMSGGILFSHRVPELEGYFEDGKEAIYFDNDQDMVDKAKFYMRDENFHLRQKLKKYARNRAASEHTWITRFQKIFDRFGL